MPRSEAQRIAQEKYNSANYDQILIRVKKGSKDEYKQAAADRAIGLMELFRRGADEYIQNHPVKESDWN